MNEVILSIKSQLVYVIENKYRITIDSFLRKFGTPEPEYLDSYFEKISNEIVSILEEHYQDIINKSQSLLLKLPDNQNLNDKDKNLVFKNIVLFINNELSQILFNKITQHILE